jgi:hypothetical protein
MSRAVGSLIAAVIGAVLGLVAAFAVPPVINGQPTQPTDPVVTYGTAT